MAAKEALARALSAIEDAQSRLQRAKRDARDLEDGAEVDRLIRAALSELDDAEEDIKKAIQELA